MQRAKDTATPRTLVVFLDGVGLGSSDPAINPLASGRYPALAAMLASAKPIDATLGVPGLPQSATGQATLLTGINAARFCGRHVEGFPGPTLREMVQRENIFLKLRQRGYHGTFANAYHLPDMNAVRALRRQSVTTVSALAAYDQVWLRDDLLAGRAVYQDITREVLRHRGLDVPVVDPETAAGHLKQIAASHDFTFFEYFQTDLMAHKGSPEAIHSVLRTVDRFLAALFDFSDASGHWLLITSDHGNIEDNTHRKHTSNPVPFFGSGAGVDAFRAEISSLVDIVPALLSRYP